MNFLNVLSASGHCRDGGRNVLAAAVEGVAGQGQLAARQNFFASGAAGVFCFLARVVVGRWTVLAFLA